MIETANNTKNINSIFLIITIVGSRIKVIMEIIMDNNFYNIKERIDLYFIEYL
jgi:hypothetical protein